MQFYGANSVIKVLKKKSDVNKPADTYNFSAAIPQIWLSNTCDEVCKRRQDTLQFNSKPRCLKWHR